MGNISACAAGSPLSVPGQEAESHLGQADVFAEIEYGGSTSCARRCSRACAPIFPPRHHRHHRLFSARARKLSGRGVGDFCMLNEAAPKPYSRGRFGHTRGTDFLPVVGTSSTTSLCRVGEKLIWIGRLGP